MKALSYPNSLVLDFFAGSGTTGRICIEENRNSIMVDNDIKLIEYFNTHKAKMQSDMFRNDYEIKENPDLNDFFEIVTNYQN